MSHLVPCAKYMPSKRHKQAGDHRTAIFIGDEYGNQAAACLSFLLAAWEPKI